MKKAIIVEDNLDLQLFTKNTLRKLKFEVDIASDGIEAAKQIQSKLLDDPEFKYDLILLDLMMPNMNGVQFLVKAKELIKDSKVIIISAKEDTNLISECIKHGASDYLIKPLDRDFLIDKVNTVFSEDLANDFAQIDTRIPIFFENDESFEGLIYRLTEMNFEFICNKKFEISDVLDFVCEELAAVTGISTNFYGRITAEGNKGKFLTYTASLVGLDETASQKLRVFTQKGKTISYRGEEVEEEGS